MKNNINPKLNPITTILGSVFATIGLLIFMLPMFVELKHDYTSQWYVPTIFIVSGVALLLTPDRFIGGLNKVIDKGSDKLGDKI